MTRRKISTTNTDRAALFGRLVEWLDYRRERFAQNDKAIASSLGVHRSLLSKWRAAAGSGGDPLDTPMPSSDVLLALGRKFDVSADWILTGRGPMLRSHVVQSGSELAAMLRERIENAIADASTPELPFDHGRSDIESQGLRVGVDVGIGKHWEVNAEAAVEWIVEKSVAEARALHQWRALSQTLMDAMAYTQYLELPDGRAYRMPKTHARRAPIPDPPDLRIVEAR